VVKLRVNKRKKIMGKLAEYLKSEAETIKKEKARRQAALKEWTDLLDGLFRQVDAWLAACDPEGLLDRTAETVELTDPALGEYKAPARRIGLGDKSIQIVPRARYVAMTIRPPGAEKPVRAQGLVELRDPVGRGFYLFQLPRDKWYIQREPRNLRESDNAVEPFDSDRFEEALASFLR
jgi:hypothetical protein